jgi:hypothetical protein
VTAAVRVVVVEDSPVQRAHLVDLLQAEDLAGAVAAFRKGELAGVLRAKLGRP